MKTRSASVRTHIPQRCDVGIKRRAAIALLASPLVARAQRPSLPVIGFLSGVSREESVGRVVAFRRGLAEFGYVEGKNAAIEFRWADGRYDRLPGMAAELVRMPVALMVATGGPRAAQAAIAATSSIPIVFTMGGDPVRMGVVQSLGRPGGNVTGVSFLTVDLVPKRVELLRDLLPQARLVVLMVNPNTGMFETQVKVAQDAARAVGHRLHVVRAGTDAEIDAVFTTFSALRPDALLVGTDAFFTARRSKLVALAARHALPVMYEGRESVVAGGLISYGPSIEEAHARAGAYVGRILGGARPADLPVLQPTNFELVINLKTAKALGLSIPQSLLLRADEVIK